MAPGPAGPRGSVIGRLRQRLNDLRPQLRVRIMLSFGLGSLVLCLIVSTTAYFGVRSSLLNQSVSSAITRATANATTVQATASPDRTERDL